MNLSLDIGNSTVKYAIFKENQLEAFGRFSDLSDAFLLKKELLHLLSCNVILNAVISNVSLSADRILDVIQILKSRGIKILNVSPDIKKPFKNNYQTPCTLGNDRIALVSGAVLCFPDDDCLIIDLGTCLTFDIKTSQNEYVGGMISLGTEMRAKAIHHFTKKLPLIPVSMKRDFLLSPGTSTNSCIYNGIYNGIYQEIQGTIDWFQTKYENPRVIFTGGNSKEIVKNIYIDVVLDEILLLKGLNYLLVCGGL